MTQNKILWSCPLVLKVNKVQPECLTLIKYIKNAHK